MFAARGVIMWECASLATFAELTVKMPGMPVVLALACARRTGVPVLVAFRNAFLRKNCYLLSGASHPMTLKSGRTTQRARN